MIIIELQKLSKKLEIRGAPAIGIAAAYALAFSQKRDFSINEFNIAFERLHRTRPTAVNLFWALNCLKETFIKLSGVSNIYPAITSRSNSNS